MSGLQALAAINTSLVDPSITVGDLTVRAKGTLATQDMFTLDHEGTSAWQCLQLPLLPDGCAALPAAPCALPALTAAWLPAAS